MYKEIVFRQMIADETIPCHYFGFAPETHLIFPGQTYMLVEIRTGTRMLSEERANVCPQCWEKSVCAHS